ncbi:hypothetical protein PHYSODRAFT_495831 [Phytophthora sojae]|uniref:Uncharacterized protein n=1 Tax=Phytophthora sojae (strain P6497) TaxID=1094619 RepID=G4Z4Y8_PHYSP|nr:hypothetical protein PHYSODRAFT_495831 [Phytophthora sojae]EGZ22317.1 hypothetical protein PHYSODRAFT_495831 [Phytophthora sojae]|eukprot:XP_009525034.1 hypothetical protein PHYSODRAFT_495831 [Phytophthora sojae]
MKWEDALSRILEQEDKRRTKLRAQKAMLDQVASCAIFKCTHEMNGKRFLISVYTRNARGYELEGLRIVAYDPRSSAAFTMVMTLREFNSLGYGQTSEGLGAFCKWLCLLYEKRRRQFRLVWSGAPCPPPLRVREHDQSLICVHKEGVKIAADSYALVAVYLRTDNPSVVRFVVGAWHGHEFLLTEHAVKARDLIINSDLDAHGIGIRVYSSEIVVNRVRYSVRVHDTNENEYTVELTPKPKKRETLSSGTHRLSLHKRRINPYDVQLSSSNFADLLSLTRFEQIPSRKAKLNDDDSDGLEWKATVSPKWAGKLANYVRVFRLAKYACKVGGVFSFIKVFVVQQKAEFRAHLLLEVTWLSPTNISSLCSVGGVEAPQSIRIPVSEYLRCVNASRRSAFEYATSCSNCAMIQYQRLHAIKELVIRAGNSASESVEFIYHAYCNVCKRLAPPIVLVLGSASTGATPWLLSLLGHYFSCFDCIHEEGLHVRDTLLQTTTRDQVVVLCNADCGVTVASANLFVNELHWWLYPDNSELPCHVAYIALHHAACQVAELGPVHLEDAGDEATDRASAFDAYLVAEAVLVEATRVLLHPDYPWPKPRKIVGASSWSAACSFLLDPVQLSANLQQCDVLQLSTTTAEVLAAYFTHAKWPHDYPNVRPFFYGLLAFMLHVQHQEVLAENTSVLDISHQSHDTEVLETLTL